MPNDKNKQLVETLGSKVKRAKSIIFADYKGLSSENLNQFRAQVKADKAEVVVAKNTLLKVALKEANVNSDNLGRDLKGPTTAIFSYEDAIKPIKTIYEFAKKFELPKVKASIIEGIYTNAQKTEEISKLPSKEMLLSRFIGGLKSPLYGLSGTLLGVQRKFVYVLAAVKDAKTEGGVQK